MKFIYWVFILVPLLSLGQRNLERQPLNLLHSYMQDVSDPDSVALIQAAIGERFVYQNIDSSIYYYEKALDYWEKEENEEKIIDVKLYYTIPLINSANYKSAYKFLEECNQYYAQSDNLKKLVRERIFSGFLAYEIGEYEEAVKIFNNAVTLGETLNDFHSINDANNRLGVVYSVLGDDKTAIEYYKKVLQVCEEQNISILKSAATNNIAESYISLNDTINAKIYLQKSIELRSKMNSNSAKHSFYARKSDLAKLEGNLDLAAVYLDSSLYFAMENKMPAQVMMQYTELADLSRIQGNIPLQIEYLKEGLKYISENSTNPYKQTIYKDLGNAYLKMGEYNNGATFLSKFIEIRDSLSKQEILNTLKINEQREFLKDYTELLKEAETKAEVQKADLKRKTIRNQFLIFFSLIASFLLAYIYRDSKIKKRQKEALEQKTKGMEKALEDREILLKEIHHRVKNNLQIVSSMLNLNLRYIGDSKVKEILQESRNRVKSMALIHKQLYMGEELKGVDLETYFKSLVNNLIHNYNQNNCKVNVEYQIEKMVLDVDTLIPIGLIANEVITNSFKHGFVGIQNGKLKVKAFLDHEILIVEFSDNGTGFDYDELQTDKQHFGMSLIQSLAQKLKADVVFSKNLGTTITLKIKEFSIYQ